MPQIEGNTYFNNFIQSGYEELKDWTPEYYQIIKEADVNLQFAGKTVDQMAQALEEWCANMFIDTMDEEALSRMEKFYYIDNSDRTLEERRMLLKSAQLGNGKMNVDRIKQIIKIYADTDCNVEFLNTLNIVLDYGGKIVSFTDIMDILGQQLPAHLAWNIKQKMYLANKMCVGVAIRQTYIAPVIT